MLPGVHNLSAMSTEICILYPLSKAYVSLQFPLFPLAHITLASTNGSR
jgi:hypothetical protein